MATIWDMSLLSHKELTQMDPSRFDCSHRLVISKPVSMIDILSISCQIVLGECHSTLLLISKHLFR